MNQARRANLDLDSDALGPVTDLYQLTMMAGYYSEGIDQIPAVFEMFVRRLPSHRSYLVCAGLEQALDALTRLRFSKEQIEALRTWPIFARVDPGFFDALASFRFTGSVWAIPEGTVVFPNEPILRVSAPLAEAQLVETLLLATIAYPTSVASKAARIVQAAQGRGVVDFGARRGHGLQASMIAARSAYLAGCLGTSQVEAARRLGIPAFGTMAHSWVQAFPDEVAAFRAFAEVFPGATLLVDTYDTPAGVAHAAAVEPAVHAIRIDSGDLGANARQARAILDSLGRSDVRILASGDLEEWKIAALVEAGAPIDDFGVGTELITCGDAPSLSLVYKLCEVAGQGKVKLSAGKRGFPFAKQVDRRLSPDGTILADHLLRDGEPCQGTPLLRPVLERGRRVNPAPALDEIREYCRQQLAALPASLLGLDGGPSVPLVVSPTLRAEADRLATELSSAASGIRLDNPRHEG